MHACARARARGFMGSREQPEETHDVALELALGVDDRVVQHGHRRDDVPTGYSEYSHGRVVHSGDSSKVRKGRLHYYSTTGYCGSTGEVLGGLGEWRRRITGTTD